MSESPPRLPKDFVEALELEFGDDRRVLHLFQQFIAYATYDRSFALSLIDVAKGRAGDSWEVRRLAALMLQQHLLPLRAGDTQEFRIVFERLALVVDGEGNLPSRVLEEGYSCRELRGFIREFRRRLTRPRCAVRPGDPGPITGEDIRAFARQSRQECKLMLAREMFDAEEVVARTRRLVRPTKGLPVAHTDGALADGTNDRAAGLPDYEASILRGLLSSPIIYWVADQTPSKLNSLVEYPLGTVVLVVKPPGSHHEFELKRAGRRGSHPLSVRSHVPPSHRLDGGSMISALRWDADATASLDHLYRLVHDEPAPVSRIVSIVGKYGVPFGDRELPILEYLTNPSLFGDGYGEMRSAMSIVVDCFRQETGSVLPPIPGDYGLTAQFLALASPAQATLRGSSSFRLDLVAKYLSANGPAEYFGRGLKVEHRAPDGKRLADDVLDEVLGVYCPPDVEYEEHDRYVAVALADVRNRARADAVYLGLLTQIGTMWGTLLGLRGYSYGESFVARNVGLRTIWSRGKWQVRLVYQDHDNLVLPGRDQPEFRPGNALPATVLDALYINGRDGVEGPNFVWNCLQRIYRVGDVLRETGRARLRRATRLAYSRTLSVIQNNPRVQHRFHRRFIDRLRDWDAVARIYLRRDHSSRGDDWKARVEKHLRRKGYGGSSISEHCRALETHGDFVETYSFLYQVPPSTPKSSATAVLRSSP
jgi:hypothetical protein